MKKIAAFIDGANIHAATKVMGFHIDWAKVLEDLRQRGQLVRAYYYTAIVESEDGYNQLTPLLDWMDYNGFHVVSKEAKQFTDYATGRMKTKGNMDIELAIDMMEMADHVDEIYLFSGDGDFRRLVEAIQRKGVRVVVVSTIKSQPPMAADEIRRQADEFIDLTDLKTIQKPQKKENYDHEKTVTTGTRSDNPNRRGLRDDRNRVAA